MHELTSGICKNAALSTTAQLMDIRDGEIYWVTKLADNNCWMTQNLNYDGVGTFTSLQDWKSSLITNDTAVYYDPGDKIVKAATSGNNGTLVDATSDTDRHLLVGNYYSWAAATRGSTGGSDGVSVTQSICPNGWVLPLGGNYTGSNNDTPGSFYYLLKQYGLESAASMKTSEYTLEGDPLYFVLGGMLSISSSGATLTSAGNTGYYWSKTIRDSSYVYYMFFNSSSVNTNIHGYRYDGKPVRCLVLGS